MNLYPKKRNIWKRLFFITIFIIASFAAIFFLQKEDSLNLTASLSETIETKEVKEIISIEEKVGQMIMLGFYGTELKEDSDIYKAIEEIKIGGVILFDYDVPSGSYPRNIINPAQTRKLIGDLQEHSKTPLFVSVDAEGGSVNRLKEKYGFLKISSAEEMAKSNTTKLESEKLAKELKSLGFNMNLAPVVDININPENPVIGALRRSFSADTSEVIDNAKIFIENHLSEKIIPVAKHFPGQGSASVDSHIGITDITDTFVKEELVPYQKLNDSGLLDVVMVAHVINKEIDEEYPATLSPAFLTDILRNQIGFEGVIMSDDMQMGAITENYEFSNAIVKAINAGTDIVVITNNGKEAYDKEIANKTLEAILNAIKEGEISEERVNESYERIMALKVKFEIIE